MTDDFQDFDTKRLQGINVDGIVISVLTGAEQGLSRGLNKHRKLPGAITLERVGREHKCSGQQSECNLFWRGPTGCMLEANGFIAFANGADFAEVCKKWQIGPPPTPLGLESPDPAQETNPQVPLEVQLEDARSIPKQQPADRPPPSIEPRAKSESMDGLQRSMSSAKLSTPSAPLCEDQRSWQTDCESTLIGDNNKVFARDQVLPMTFLVLSGSSRAIVEAMIIVSPILFVRLKADRKGTRWRHHRTSKPSIYHCRPEQNP